MRLPRVLHLTRRYWPLEGGTERYVAWLAEAQVQRGHEVTVGCLSGDVAKARRGRLAAAEMHGGVRIRRMAGFGGRRWTVVLDVPTLLTLIAGAEVVHLHDLRFPFATAVIGSALFRRALLVHTHGLIFHTPFMERVKRLAVAKYFGPLLQASSAVIVASSQSDADLILALRPELASKVRVIENAIPMEKYVTIERNPDRGELLILGRVADSKRIDLALRALAQLKDEGWHLTIAGSAEPETLDRLRALARQLSLLDRVDFATEISEPTKNALLARAQMALFPSQGEGFGLALLEVVASGVPALAQDIPAHRALLGPEHLTDFRDSAKAARRLRTLLGQPAFQPARYPTTRHARRYDLSRLVGEIEEVYASLGLEIAGRAQQVLR